MVRLRGIMRTLWRRFCYSLGGQPGGCILPLLVKVRDPQLQHMLEAGESVVRSGPLTLFVVDAHFDAEIYVAGFASKLSNPKSMSRSQRAFLRLAKGVHASHCKQFIVIQLRCRVCFPSEVAR